MPAKSTKHFTRSIPRVASQLPGTAGVRRAFRFDADFAPWNGSNGHGLSRLHPHARDTERHEEGLRQGAIAGIVAGIVFAAFEMIVSALVMGPAAFFMPLRMIGAIA